MKKVYTISIILKQGVIQDIVGMPKNIRVRVLDFDFGGSPEDKSIHLLKDSRVKEAVWPKGTSTLNQDIDEKKLTEIIPDSCPECGCPRDSFICKGLQATSSDIQSVDEKVIYPSSLDMSDWSITPVLILCGECERLIWDHQLNVAKTILLWEKD